MNGSLVVKILYHFTQKDAKTQQKMDFSRFLKNRKIINNKVNQTNKYFKVKIVYKAGILKESLDMVENNLIMIMIIIIIKYTCIK